MNLKPQVPLCQLESRDFFGSHFELDSTLDSGFIWLDFLVIFNICLYLVDF